MYSEQQFHANSQFCGKVDWVTLHVFFRVLDTSFKSHVTLACHTPHQISGANHYRCFNETGQESRVKTTFCVLWIMRWGDIPICTKAKSLRPLPKEMKADSPDAIESLKEGSVRSVICTGDNVWRLESRTGPHEHPSTTAHRNCKKT